MAAVIQGLKQRLDRLLPASGDGGPARPRVGLRLLWYLALAVLVTWPIASDPLRLVLGHPQASAPCHVWVLWWAQNHLADIHTELLFFPNGADVVTLYGSDVLSPLLLRWIPLSPVLLYNLWVPLLLVAGSLGVDRLAASRGATGAGALLAGSIFTTASFLQHETLNGTSEIVAVGAIAWFLLALFAVLERRDRGSWRRPSRRTLLLGLALGASYGIAVSLSAYNLFFGLLAAAVVVLAHLATRIEPVFTRPVLQASAAAVVGVLPFGAFLAWLQATHGAGEVYSRRGNWASPELAMPDSFAELQAWLDRSDAVIPVTRELPFGELFEYWTTCTVYMGIVAVALGLVGWWRGPARATGGRRRGTGVFIALLLVAALVASGPYLRWQGAPIQLAGTALPMPALLLADVFPPFTITAVHAYRYAGLVLIALAVLAGFALRSPRAVAAAIAAVVVDAVLLGPVPWPAPTTKAPRSRTLEGLAAAPPGGVLHIPIEAEHLGDLGEILLAQTIHGKPVQDGGIHRRAGEEATALFRELPLLGDLAARGELDLPGERSSRWGLRQLHAAGYRYVLARQGEGEDPAATAWADQLLGAPMDADGSWIVWRLEDADLVSGGGPPAPDGEPSPDGAPPTDASPEPADAP